MNDELEECYNMILDIIKSEKKGLKKKQDQDKILKKIKELVE